MIDPVVDSNFCLGQALEPQPQNEGYSGWLATHECQRNIDCNSDRMEVEAALAIFQRSLVKHDVCYSTILSDLDSQTFHTLSGVEVCGFIKVGKEDCVNHVHKRMRDCSAEPCGLKEGSR